MNISHLYSRPSDNFSTTNGDDLVWNDPFNSPTHVTINGLGGEDILAFSRPRGDYTNLSITTEADGSTRITGILSYANSGFGFVIKQYIDTSVSNFEKIRFPNSNGGFEYVELAGAISNTQKLVRGTSSNDTISSTGNNDDIDGDDGIDTVTYSGSRSSFELAQISSGYRLSRGGSDVDTFAHVERLQFSDKKVACRRAFKSTQRYALNFTQGL